MELVAEKHAIVSRVEVAVASGSRAHDSETAEKKGDAKRDHVVVVESSTLGRPLIPIPLHALRSRLTVDRWTESHCVD